MARFQRSVGLTQPDGQGRAEAAGTSAPPAKLGSGAPDGGLDLFRVRFGNKWCWWGFSSPVPSSRDTAWPGAWPPTKSSGKVDLIHSSGVSAGGEAGPQSPRVGSHHVGLALMLPPPATLLYHRVLRINCPNNSEEKTQLGQKSGDTELGGRLRAAPITVSGPRDVAGRQTALNKTRVIRTLHIPAWR